MKSGLNTFRATLEVQTTERQAPTQASRPSVKKSRERYEPDQFSPAVLYTATDGLMSGTVVSCGRQARREEGEGGGASEQPCGGMVWHSDTFRENNWPLHAG